MSVPAPLDEPTINAELVGKTIESITQEALFTLVTFTDGTVWLIRVARR